MKRFQQLFTILLVPFDYTALVASFALAYWLRISWQFHEVIYIQPFDEFMKFAALISLIWVIVFGIFGLYRFRGFNNRWSLLGHLLTAISVGLALFIIGLFLTKTTFVSRLIVVYFWVLSPFVILVVRGILGYIKQWFQYYGVGVERVIIIANTTITDVLKKYLASRRPAQKLVATFETFHEDELTRRSIDRIILGEELPKSDMLRLIRFCEDKGIVLQYVPSLIGLYTSQMTMDTVAGYPLIELSPTPLAGWGRIAKRAFDVVATTCGMVIILPLMAVVAIAIKLDSKGPVIFAQKRIGELGEPFTFFKFRSMYTEMSTGEGYGGKAAEELRAKLEAEKNEGAGLLFKVKDDPRVTRVGRFIRKTSLDELPQFFNVLIGNMSLVGPRPALPSEVEKYDDVTKRRLLIKPGITGLWQVSGRSDASFEEYVKLDTYYIEHWSLWQDIRILFLTVWVVLAKRGSY